MHIPDRHVHPALTRLMAVTVVLLVACGSPSRPPSAPPPTGTLAQMLAPIALYPDPLLAQMLMSAVNPAKITELDQWMRSNTTLKGTELQNAAVKAGFDASYVALALFPQVVSYMAQNISWTTSLGQWFTTDRETLFDGIQKLRRQAESVGTLKSSPQQEVEKKTTASGEQVIVIEPANPQIVYVPQYNPEVVYTQPPTTVVVVQEDNNADVAVAAGLIGFTAGIAIGAAVNNNYYYGPYGWHGGGYMYNDAWNDYYDAREDARDDWMDHREDLVDERSDRLEDRQGQRSDRTETRQGQRTERAENRPEATEAQRAQAQQRAQERQTQGASTQSASAPRSRTGSAEARGYSSDARTQPKTERPSSDAFAGYSSGASQRASSSRGQTSRSTASRGASRGGGGGRRR